MTSSGLKKSKRTGQQREKTLTLKALQGKIRQGWVELIWRNRAYVM